MRKTLIALFLAASLPTVALAMPADCQHQGGERSERGAPMLKELDLSKEQRQSIGKLMREQMDSRREISQSFLDKLPAADKQAMQEQLKAAKTKNEQAIRALLKPEQQKGYDAALAKMTERHAEMAEFQAWKAERAKKAE
ncbi:MAG: LTXXQ domain protein [Pseudomonas sp.]|jgi:Spy/CpxP family protein refolding chaperone|nr:LTXXQ domain protein [Pseudomonas sp.]